MDINLFQAFLIGVIYYLGVTGVPWFTLIGSVGVIQKPLVSGLLVGLVLGDPIQGVIIGAAIQLPYIAFITAGGTAAVDPGLAGTLGTALALATKVDAQTATTLAIPLGLLGTIIWVIHMTVDVVFVHLADKAADEGNLARINFLHVVPPQIFLFFISVVPVTLAAYFGVDLVSDLISSLTGRPLHILQTIGGLLPALGIALNLRSMNRPNTLLFFILGFLMFTYLSLDIIVIAIFGSMIALAYTSVKEGQLIN